MGLPSLKKTGRALRGKEGNYASSEEPASSKDFSDLGLTLHPGSQISKGERKLLTPFESRKLDPCVERCCRQREKIDEHFQENDEPTAPGVSSRTARELGPFYFQAVTGVLHAPRSRELCSSTEQESPTCGNESLVNPVSTSCSYVSPSQDSSSSLSYAVDSENGMQDHGHGEIKNCYSFRDPHNPIYSTKRRRIQSHDAPGLRSESVFDTGPPSVLHAAGQSRNLKTSQGNMRRKNVPPGKHTSDLGHALPQGRYCGQVKRSQRMAGAGSVSAITFSSCQFTGESGCKDSYHALKAVGPRGRSSESDLLETSPFVSPPQEVDYSDGGRPFQKDGADSRLSAEHWGQVKLQSMQWAKRQSTSTIWHLLTTDCDTSSSSSIRPSRGADRKALVVEPDVPDDLISPLGSTLPLRGILASGKCQNHLNVHQPYQFLHDSVLQHFNFTFPVPPNFYNHPSYISTISSKDTNLHSDKSGSNLHKSANTASPYSTECRIRRHSTTSLLQSSSFLAIRIAITKPRQRSNSVPYLNTIHLTEIMNTPDTSQPFRLTHEQVNHQIQQSYAMQPLSCSQSPAQVQSPQHGTTNQHASSHGAHHAVDRSLQSGMSLNHMTSHFAQMIAILLQRMGNDFTESPSVIASCLKVLFVKLSQSPQKEAYLHRTLRFLDSFPVTGSPEAVPLDESLMQAQHEMQGLKMQVALAVKQKNQSLENCKQQHHALMANLKTIEKQQESAVRQSKEIERLRRDALHWKDQAEQVHRLLSNAPPKALSSGTLCQRISQGGATAGTSMLSSERHAVAAKTPSDSHIAFPTAPHQKAPVQAVTFANDNVEMGRRNSTFSSASSELVDLTAEHSTPTKSASSLLSSPVCRQPSSEEQLKATPGQMVSKGRRRPSWLASRYPEQNLLNLSLYGRETPDAAQTVIDVDAMQQPFVFDPSAEELVAAEARKSNASYASYQQKSRVTKNRKAPKLTKAQQQEHENEHAPPPIKSKKARKPRVWKARETPEEKAARIADEKKTAERDAVLQERLFQASAVERQAREQAEREMAEIQATIDAREQKEAKEREAENVAEMEALLDATMTNAGNGSAEPTTGVNEEQAIPEAASRILHGSAQDTTIPHAADTVQDVNTDDSQESAAIAADNDGLDGLFEDDVAMEDEPAPSFEEAATAPFGSEKEPEATEAACVPENDLDIMLADVEKAAAAPFEAEKEPEAAPVTSAPMSDLDAMLADPEPHPAGDLSMFMQEWTSGAEQALLDANDPMFEPTFFDTYLP